MKKLGLIILGSFMLLTSTVLSCPDEKFHDLIQLAIQKSNGAIRVAGKNMYVKTGALRSTAVDEKGYERTLAVLLLYCANHNLKFVSK